MSSYDYIYDYYVYNEYVLSYNLTWRFLFDKQLTHDLEYLNIIEYIL